MKGFWQRGICLLCAGLVMAGIVVAQERMGEYAWTIENADYIGEVVVVEKQNELYIAANYEQSNLAIWNARAQQAQVISFPYKIGVFDGISLQNRLVFFGEIYPSVGKKEQGLVILMDKRGQVDKVYALAPSQGFSELFQAVQAGRNVWIGGIAELPQVASYTLVPMRSMQPAPLLIHLRGLDPKEWRGFFVKDQSRDLWRIYRLAVASNRRLIVGVGEVVLTWNKDHTWPVNTYPFVVAFTPDGRIQWAKYIQREAMVVDLVSGPNNYFYLLTQQRDQNIIYEFNAEGRFTRYWTLKGYFREIHYNEQEGRFYLMGFVPDGDRPNSSIPAIAVYSPKKKTFTVYTDSLLQVFNGTGTFWNEQGITWWFSIARRHHPNRLTMGNVRTLDMQLAKCIRKISGEAVEHTMAEEIIRSFQPVLEPVPVAINPYSVTVQYRSVRKSSLTCGQE